MVVPFSETGNPRTRSDPGYSIGQEKKGLCVLEMEGKTIHRPSRCVPPAFQNLLWRNGLHAEEELG